MSGRRFIKANPFDKFLGPEDILQIQLCVFLVVAYPGVKIHHSPNEGKRSAFEQYKLKKLGASKGFPDLLLIYRSKVIVIELKAGYNKPTPEQAEWIAAFNAADVPSAWFNDFEKARAFVDFFFRPLKIVQ